MRTLLLAMLFLTTAGEEATCEDNDPARTACDDVNDSCPHWASIGECEANKGYMVVECARSCRTCHLRDPKVRCKRDPDEPAAMANGTLDSVFRRAVAEWPSLQPRVLSEDPWVIVFDAFLSPEEVADLLAVYDTKTLERSSNVGRMNDLGRYEKSLDSSRTSENAWCDGGCQDLPAIRRVSQRIGNVTGVSEAQSEFLQLLRYEPGQYYRQHHDFIPSHLQFPFGPRLFTMFLYLSDVEEGGATRFNRLNIDVAPKAGRAVWWPSVKQESSTTADYRTQHEAMPVTRGIKYAANAWLHLYDFRTPHSNGCAP